MIIHHYYPDKTNIGDRFVVDGIRKLIRDSLPESEFVDIPVNGRRETECFGLRAENLDHSNSEADLIVIGGSNLYQCRRNGAWGVTTDLDSIRKVKKPIMLIGLGNGSAFRNKVRDCNAQSRAEICLLNKVAVGSSVRDLYSGRFLHSLGIENCSVTGCPATFLFENRLTFEKGDTVAIAFPSKGFKKHRFMYSRLVSAMKKYVCYCRQAGLQAVVSCHDVRDIEFAKAVEKDGAELFYSENASDYYELYAQARLTVGFRLHAAIISFSLGTPFVPIYFDMRGLAFSETYDSLEWAIDGTRPNLYRRLIQRTEDILEGKEAVFANFLANKEKYRKIMRSFVDSCIQKI